MLLNTYIFIKLPLKYKDIIIIIEVKIDIPLKFWIRRLKRVKISFPPYPNFPNFSNQKPSPPSFITTVLP